MGRFAYGYVIAAACFSIQAIGIGSQVAFGVFFNPLMAEFGWSRAVIAGASSVAFLNMGLCGVLIGRLNDRYGPRLLMTVTAAFFGLGYGLMSQITTIWQLYLVYGLIFGIGQSAIDVIALTTVARWFSRNRGMMTGIVKVGTGAGQLIIPLSASALIATYGWRNAYVVIGTAALILLVLIAQILRRDPEQHVNAKKGLHPISTSEIEGIPLKAALRTAQLWTICLLNLASVFCLMIIVVHIVPHSRDIGLPPPIAAGVLATVGGVSMVGRFMTGLAIDRVGSRKVMFVCFVMLITAFLWIQLARTPWMLYFFAVVYGLAHGGFFTAISPLVAELFGVGAHGALFGLVVCFGTVGGSIGPIIAGSLFDKTGSYSPAFWMITVICAVGLGLLMSLRPIQRNH